MKSMDSGKMSINDPFNKDERKKADDELKKRVVEELTLKQKESVEKLREEVRQERKAREREERKNVIKTKPFFFRY